jgi:hypothetical protein
MRRIGEMFSLVRAQENNDYPAIAVMGIPKKGSRRMCVARIDYRYIARELSPGVRITVQKFDPPGSLLVLKSEQDRAIAHVPPSQIAALIQQAVHDGWNPHQSGAPFERAVAL